MGRGVSGLNLGQTRSHQVWNQTDWTPLQVTLDLWVYSQDWQAPVMGHGGWWRISPGLEGGKLDPTKMELAQTPRQSLSSSFKKCKMQYTKSSLLENMALIEELLNISYSSSQNLHSSETFSGLILLCR